VGITQYGASFHYITGRLAQAAGFDLKSVTLRPLQTIANMQAAVQTGQVDVSYAIASQAYPLEKSGEVHILGWVGDTVPYQLTALFAPSPMLAGRADAIAAFCRAYAKGVDDVRAAFLRPDGKGGFIRDATTEVAIPPIAKYVYANDPNAGSKIIDTMGYYDAGAALDAADVAAQLRWFIGQGLVRGPIDPADIIDTRFLPTLPATK
jgi:NitT/TauT family transport system substrate-binding protein